MDDKKYSAYSEAMEAAKDMHDKELLNAIKARVIAENGADDEDVKTLFDYHG